MTLCRTAGWVGGSGGLLCSPNSPPQTTQHIPQPLTHRTYPSAKDREAMRPLVTKMWSQREKRGHCNHQETLRKLLCIVALPEGKRELSSLMQSSQPHSPLWAIISWGESAIWLIWKKFVILGLPIYLLQQIMWKMPFLMKQLAFAAVMTCLSSVFFKICFQLHNGSHYLLSTKVTLSSGFENTCTNRVL